MHTMDSFNFKGHKALVRVDLNVPLDAQFNVTDDNRTRAIVPTVKKILKDGGSAILMSHLGRPKGKVNPAMSLKPITKHLEGLLGVPVQFATDCIGPDAQAKAAALKPGEVLLLENLRFHPEEEAGDEGFSKALSTLGDVYVNDAFGTAHRAHASTTIVAKYFPQDKLFGYLVAGELDSIGKVLENPQKPLCAIVGGAKVSSKIEVLKNLLGKCDEVIIGGGMAFTFIKAQGGKTGASLVEEDHIKTATEILAEAKDRGVLLHLPVDAVVADAFADNANTDLCARAEEVFEEVLALVVRVRQGVNQELAGAGAAERIREGFEVAIVGAPNVGKSTLLNALAGRDAAITSDVAGTTRDVIEVRMEIAGLSVTLLDTAGLRDTEDQIERKGIVRALDRARAADLRLFLKEDGESLPLEPEPDDLVVLCKADLRQDADGAVSGVTGQGLDHLIARIGTVLSERVAGSSLVIRERHRHALTGANDSLESAEVGLRASAPVELVAADLRAAAIALEIMIGRVGVEDLLEEIFSRFCIGK
jgi:phosphoglycerate kinase